MVSVWKFGGVSISVGQESALIFNNALSKLHYERIYSPPLNTENIDRELVGRLIGFRAVIKCKIFNVDSDDYVNIVRLFSDINRTIAFYGNCPFRVMPRYNSTDPDNIDEECKLASSIEMQDVANFDCGQTLDLEFIGTNISRTIPTTFDGAVTDNIIDESGNLLINENGNYIVYI